MIDYTQAGPETAAFMNAMDDSEIVWDKVFGKMNDIELERNEALELLRSVAEYFETMYVYPHSDAPGHTHRVKGVWDCDGRPCEWCATWERVKEMTRDRGKAFDSLRSPALG